MTDKVFRIIIITAVLVCTIRVYGLPAEDRRAGEYQVKATFLYNFARFVEWPKEAFVSDDGDITLCILGKDPFKESLNYIEGKTVRGRRLVIKHKKSLAEPDKCNILFITRSERKRLGEIFKALKGKSVLTVGDMDGFAKMGGIINFIRAGNKIHFEINVDSAKENELKISSSLLKLAKIVRNETEGENN